MGFGDLRRAFVGALALVTLLAPGLANALSGEEQAALQQITAKLSSVQTMDGEFVQYNPNGDQVTGKFYIARPGRVRFQYDPPTTLSVIADGKSVLVFDKKLQTYDIWPLSQTPLRLLLEDNLNLLASDKVTRVGVAPDLIEVEMRDETRFSSGTLNLIFDSRTLDLRQWTVTDEQGLQTMVALYNVETGKKLAADLFKIDYQAATNAARERN
jgi:outer membrane lipoprotein-sorting protein